jgi:hypothetical protein
MTLVRSGLLQQRDLAAVVRPVFDDTAEQVEHVVALSPVTVRSI